MEAAEILEKMERLLDQNNEHGLYRLGRERAMRSALFYDLENQKSAILSTIKAQFNDLSSVKAEDKAKTHPKYNEHLIKLADAKLQEGLAWSAHVHAQTLYNYFDRCLSWLQSQAKLR